MRGFAYLPLMLLAMLLCACQQNVAGYAYSQQRHQSAWGAEASRRYAQNPIPQRVRQSSGATVTRVQSRVAAAPQRPVAYKPATPAPKPTSAAVCVIDPRTGTILYEHNARQRRQVASTQKLVTALCVCDAGNLDKRVTITREDCQAPPIRLGLKPGTTYRRGDLLRVMLTGSYNDVAVTLARDAAGSVPRFVDRMNARARRMRMYDTHFENPNGLPANQYSTAHDMALAACHAYYNKTIRSMICIPEFSFTLADGSKKRIRSTNKLLKDYPWVRGMKTGYTRKAGKCLISCGTYKGREVIVVILGSTNQKIWNESLRYLRWALGMS